MDSCTSSENSELETMGNILSTSNEEKAEHKEGEPLVNDNIEVKTVDEPNCKHNMNVESTENSRDKSEDNLKEIILSQDIDEHEKLWLEGNTRQLVKVDTDEDFEVIVKSLETAIVETERYDNDLPFNIPSSPSSSSVQIDQHQGDDENFTTVPTPKIESFDEKSSSLFENIMEPKVDQFENETSLLKLQDTSMPQIISENTENDEILIGKSLDHSDTSEICESSCDEDQKPEEKSIFLRRSLDINNENSFLNKKVIEDNSEIKNVAEKTICDKKEKETQNEVIEIPISNDVEPEIFQISDNETDLSNKINLELYKETEKGEIEESQVIEVTNDNDSENTEKVDNINENNKTIDNAEKEGNMKNREKEIETKYETKVIDEKQEDSKEENNVAYNENVNRKMLTETDLNSKTDLDENAVDDKTHKISEEKYNNKEEIIFKEKIIQLSTRKINEQEKVKETVVENVENTNLSDVNKCDVTFITEVKEVQKRIEIKEPCKTKHSCEENIDEQSPPKKIKLIRDKFQTYSVVTNEPENKNIELDKQTVVELVCDKLEDLEVKQQNKICTKPAQKLKLQRNYKLPEKLTERKIEKICIDKEADKSQNVIKEVILQQKVVEEEIQNINRKDVNTKECDNRPVNDEDDNKIENIVQKIEKTQIIIEEMNKEANNDNFNIKECFAHTLSDDNNDKTENLVKEIQKAETIIEKEKDVNDSNLTVKEYNKTVNLVKEIECDQTVINEQSKDANNDNVNKKECLDKLADDNDSNSIQNLIKEVEKVEKVIDEKSKEFSSGALNMKECFDKSIDKDNNDKNTNVFKEIENNEIVFRDGSNRIQNDDLIIKECFTAAIHNVNIDGKEEESQHMEKIKQDTSIKLENLLSIDTQYPLLASRLQEKLPPKDKKEDLKIIPVVFPALPEKLVDNIGPLLSLDSVMKSATKIKITKRKIEEATKPLSVDIDDVESENIPKIVIKPIQKPSSPKITIKPIKPSNDDLSMAMSTSSHSPKITIKPIVKPDPLKITITKQKSDDTHSILKIYQPDQDQNQDYDKIEKAHSPRITIKPIIKPSLSSPKQPIDDYSDQTLPKLSIKSLPMKQKHSIEILHSPKMIHVNPPSESHPKVTIKPVLSPRQIKPVRSMTFESSSGITVEPICVPETDSQLNMTSKISVKSFAKLDDSINQSKLTIKPITKTCEIVQTEAGSQNPLKLTIKPILKPEESYQSPKITIKPVVKSISEEIEQQQQQFEQELPGKPERIILKIQKTNLSSPKEPEVKIEPITIPDQKLDKIKLKLTKEGNHAQIIPTDSTSSNIFSLKRTLTLSEASNILEKRSKTDFPDILQHSSDISINIVEPNSVKPTITQRILGDEVTILKIDKTPMSEQQISQSKFKEMLLKIQQKPEITLRTSASGSQQKNIIDVPENEYSSASSSSDDVKIISVTENEPLKDPLSLQEESNSQDVMIVNEIINNPFQAVQIVNPPPIETCVQTTPKKRGRPRKNPLEVKPEIKGEDCVEVRPKRSCRGTPGRTSFVAKERRPRGSGRGRGGYRGRGSKALQKNAPKEVKSGRGGGKTVRESRVAIKEVVIDEITIEDSTNDTTPAATPIPPPFEADTPPSKKSDVKDKMNEEIKEPYPVPVVYEEETRMSAENSNNNKTQVTVPLTEGPEESQSSVQSTATTESSKTKKGRLEGCDLDSVVTSVDQIVEYSWGNSGPYMLQEQIAQYLGVKSFKRKYPGLTRRSVEMQERDYIREKGLVSESMCDMGLTAVLSSEILDIMYSDFQDKYEEYRKCLRDKQAKEISNKQKAVSLATSLEKNKLDFKERAIRSTANWNSNFNKARKESRKCFMDLQTFTINYPIGKVKVPNKHPVGHYPVALVPGQFTDYYKKYSSNELNYLPLNTVRFGPVLPNQRCDITQSDGSQSESESSSGSDSDSSDESMSTEEESTTHTSVINKTATVQLTPLSSTLRSKLL